VPAAAKVELMQKVRAEPAAAPAAPDRDKALQAAVVALQSP
jgi:hypothetical protein